jgi:hypothetical protein
MITISIPKVQSYIAYVLTEDINNKYDTNIDIERVSISFFGNIKLNDALIKDHHNDTLIYFNELKTSVQNVSKINQNKFDLSGVEFEQLKFNLKRYRDEDDDNLIRFFNQFESKKKETASEPVNISLSYFSAIESQFSYVNENISSPTVIDLKEMTMNLENIKINQDGVFIDIQQISGKAGNGLDVQELAGDFSYTDSALKLNQLQLQTAFSNVDADLGFYYENNDMSDFEDQVQLKAKFRPSSINTTDLRNYYDEFGNNKDLLLSGELSGTLNNMKWKETQISGLTQTNIKTQDLQLKNLIASDRGFLISGDFEQLATSYPDLINLLPNLLKDELPSFLKRLGQVDFKGNNMISDRKIDINSKIKTDLGNLNLDADFLNYTDQNQVSYTGRLNIKNFNVGKLLNEENLGLTQGVVDINGIGFTTNSLNTAINGKIAKINFNDYDYRNISLNGDLKHPVFDGSLTSKDENLDFEFNGLVDVSKSLNQYEFKTSIKHADLHAINWVKRDTLSIFKGKIDVDLKGTTLNDVTGNIALKNVSYENQIEKYAFNQLSIISKFENEKRRIDIKSDDVVSGYIEGVFRIEELPEVFQQSIENLYFNKKPNNDKNFRYVDFNISIKNKIVDVLFPDVKIKPNTFISGSIVKDENIFKFRFNSPQINIVENRIQNIDLQIDNTNPLYNTYIKVDSIASPTYPVSELSLINKNINDTLYFRTEFKGGKSNNDDVNLSLYQTNQGDDAIIGFQNSKVKFKNTIWQLNPDNNKNNRVVFDRNFSNFRFDSIAMRYQDEKVSLVGKVRDSTYKDITLGLENVRLRRITPDIDSLKMNGIVNGKAKIFQEKGLYAPNMQIKVDSLKMNQTRLGELNLFADGDEAFKDFTIKATMADRNTKYLDAKGTIQTKEDQQFIDLDLATDQFDLNIFSPLGQDVVSNIRGKLSGQAKITGKLKNPDFNGRYMIKNGGIGVPYLNVDYDFGKQETLRLSGKKIIFDDFDLTDTEYQTNGNLNGNISHQYFSKWNLDLSISTDNLVALNTKFKEGELYYGTAFISGNASIFGPTDALTIDVDAQTQPNTVFKIPLDDTRTLADNSYIYFLNEEDKKNQQNGNQLKLREVSGLNLNFDLDVTNDAEVEILIDQESGSTLVGSGAGNLLIEINTNGKFNMWGDFVAYEGIYNFKYAGLVQKEFQVIPGGSLTWNGNPLDANMNVQAKYSTEANPSVVLENTNVNREIPVDVLINLRGQLMQPNIEFELNYPNLSSVVKSELDYRIQGEENRELQALSLVTQGSFYSLQGLGQNAIAGNLIERASGIVDNILATESEKIKLGVNYQQGMQTPNQNAQTADRVGMTFKTKISDRISFKGKFGVPVGGETDSFIFGDVELSLMLNKSGSLRATAFNRESEIQFIGEELGYTQGVGISYSVDFDTLRELIDKVTNKDKKEKEPVNMPAKNNDKSVVPEYIKLKREK